MLHRDGFRFSHKILFLALSPGGTCWGKSPELLCPPNNAAEKGLGGAQGSWEQSLQGWAEQGSSALEMATELPSLPGQITPATLGDREHHRTGTSYQLWGEGRIKQLTLLLLKSPASLLPAQEHHLPPKSRRWRIPHRCLQDNTPLAWNWNNAISRSNVVSLNSYSCCTALADITGFWTSLPSLINDI